MDFYICHETEDENLHDQISSEPQLKLTIKSINYS